MDCEWAKSELSKEVTKVLNDTLSDTVAASVDRLGQMLGVSWHKKDIATVTFGGLALMLSLIASDRVVRNFKRLVLLFVWSTCTLGWVIRWRAELHAFETTVIMRAQTEGNRVAIEYVGQAAVQDALRQAVREAVDATARKRAEEYVDSASVRQTILQTVEQAGTETGGRAGAQSAKIAQESADRVLALEKKTEASFKAVEACKADAERIVEGLTAKMAEMKVEDVEDVDPVE